MNKVKPISAKERRFDFDRYGMSIAPDYTGQDLLGFKKGSQHLHTKFKMVKRIG